MFKSFPMTAKGDQLRIEFEYEEERRAFNAVKMTLESFLAKNEKKKIMEDFKFDTTLEYEVANEHARELGEIFDITFNVYAKDSTYISRHE